MKFAVACLLGLASATEVVTLEEPKDMQKCIDDIEGLIPGVEKVIQDLKDGNQNKAILDLTLILPKAEAAYNECTGSGKNRQLHKKMMKLKYSLKNANPEDLPTCISDIEAAIPDLEKVIADFKAKNYDQALTDALALVPAVEKAYTDCLSSKTKEFKQFHKVRDLPTCIADLEAAIPDVEKVIADFKAGNYDQALTDALALVPAAEKAYTDCLSKSSFLKDLPTCIADIEAAIPDLEKVIADFKAGNYEQALTDGLALVPTIEKAATDCLSSSKPHLAHGFMRLRKFLSKINVGDLPTCIADIEAAIPDLEKVIADFKAGNYDQALTDALALVPTVEKAYTDCLSSGKQIVGKFKTVLKDDPKREYFEKLGAEFASGFFTGAKVDHFDTIDLYNCLHREPNAVGLFYKADETLKYALQKHEPEEAVKAMDELIQFLATMVMDEYPGTKRQVCREFQDREAQYGDLKLIIEKLKDPQTTLKVEDHKFEFNHHDITARLGEVVQDYVKSSWSRLGYSYASTLLDAAANEQFLQ